MGPTPQLDLFEHSRDTMLRNDVLDALLRRDAAAAALAQQALAEFDALHGALPALQVLVGALGAAADTTALARHADAARARAQLLGAVLPAAQAQLGSAAAAGWMMPLWRGLAQRAAPLPFLPAQPDDHAAPLWLRVGDAAAATAAAQAVQRIESWRRIPAPLGWMAQARYRSAGLDSTWPLLLELAWLATPRFADTAQALADPLLNRLLRRFDGGFDPGLDEGSAALAWFPAWLLIDHPALLPLLREAHTGQNALPEQVFRLIAELLGLERQGRHHEVIAGRKRLRDLQPALYAVYMKAR